MTKRKWKIGSSLSSKSKLAVLNLKYMPVESFRFWQNILVCVDVFLILIIVSLLYNLY